MESAVQLLNTYKIKFEYTNKGVNLMSDEEYVALIEHGEDGEVDSDE